MFTLSSQFCWFENNNEQYNSDENNDPTQNNVPKSMNKTKGNFRKLNIQTRRKPGRSGEIDTTYVIEVLKEDWSALQDGLNTMSKEEKDAVKKYFNEICPEDDDELGDVLFGDVDDFDAQIQALNDEPKAKFVNALFDVEVLDKNHMQSMIQEAK